MLEAVNPSEQNPQESSSLSFESLRSELGDLPIPPPSAEGTLPLEDAGLELDHEEASPFVAEESTVEAMPRQEIRMEALTGSSPQRRPLWVDALFCIVFALMLVASILFKSGFVSFEPWISRIATLLALGGAGWAMLGLRSAKSVAGKRFTWGIVVAGLIVAFMAYLVRMP